MALVQDIKGRVQNVLLDPIRRALGEDAIYEYIYEAEVAVLRLKPDALVQRIVYTCQEGIHQNISTVTPAPMQLLSCMTNSYDDHLIRVSDERISQFSPLNNGLSDRPAIYILDASNPLGFHVYPPANTQAKIRISYTPMPEPYYNAGADFTIVPNAYLPAIIDYALMRCYEESKSDDPAAVSKSQIHKAKFDAYLGMATQEEIRTSDDNPRYSR